AVLEHLLRRATADTAQRLLGGLDVGPIVTAIEHGSPVTTGARVSAREVLAALPEVSAVAEIQQRLEAQSDGQRAAAIELALEALYLAKRIDKVSDEGETVYG
ncbi:MAG: magnesium chelatase, partial [Mycobacterium sp.]|nr:magnesium chelatase [Mycobacterium sp.]